MFWSISYKYIDRVALYNEKQCVICKKAPIEFVQVEQGYIKFFGLPIAKVAKKYFCICPQCHVRQKYKESPEVLDILRDQEIKTANFNFYWGWLIIAPILLSIIYLFYKIQ